MYVRIQSACMSVVTRKQIYRSRDDGLFVMDLIARSRLRGTGRCSKNGVEVPSKGRFQVGRVPLNFRYKCVKNTACTCLHTCPSGLLTQAVIEAVFGCGAPSALKGAGNPSSRALVIGCVAVTLCSRSPNTSLNLLSSAVCSFSCCGRNCHRIRIYTLETTPAAQFGKTEQLGQCFTALTSSSDLAN